MWTLLAALAACDTEPVRTPEEFRAEVESAEPQRRLMLLQTHVTRNPDDANAHLWLARAYRERKDARAEFEFAEAIRLAPSDPVPRVELSYYAVEDALRRGVDPDPAVLDAAQARVAEVAGDGASCETRHALIGLYDLERDAGRVDPAYRAYLESSLAACDQPSTVANWRAALGRLRLAEGDVAGAAESLCAAVRDGNAEAAGECVEVSSRGVGTWTPAAVGERLAAAELQFQRGEVTEACQSLDAVDALDTTRAAAAYRTRFQCPAAPPVP